MGGKRMAKGVATGGFGQPGFEYGSFDRFL